SGFTLANSNARLLTINIPVDRIPIEPAVKINNIDGYSTLIARQTKSILYIDGYATGVAKEDKTVWLDGQLSPINTGSSTDAVCCDSQVVFTVYISITSSVHYHHATIITIPSSDLG